MPHQLRMHSMPHRLRMHSGPCCPRFHPDDSDAEVPCIFFSSQSVSPSAARPACAAPIPVPCSASLLFFFLQHSCVSQYSFLFSRPPKHSNTAESRRGHSHPASCTHLYKNLLIFRFLFFTNHAGLLLKSSAAAKPAASIAAEAPSRTHVPASRSLRAVPVLTVCVESASCEGAMPWPP